MNSGRIIVCLKIIITWPSGDLIISLLGKFYRGGNAILQNSQSQKPSFYIVQMLYSLFRNNTALLFISSLTISLHNHITNFAHIWWSMRKHYSKLLSFLCFEKCRVGHRWNKHYSFNNTMLVFMFVLILYFTTSWSTWYSI